jgi:hypothetical protein
MNAMNNFLILWKTTAFSHITNLFKKSNKNTTNSNRDNRDYIRVRPTPTSSIVYPTTTSSMMFSTPTLKTKNMDETPIKHFIKKWFPFVIDVTHIQVSNGTTTTYDPYTFVPKQKGTIVTINLTMSSIHFTELYFDKNIEHTFNKRMDEKLHTLIRVLYADVVPIDFYLKLVFFPQKSSTILEYLS